MIDSTLNSGLIFVTREPSWEYPVMVEMSAQSTMYTSRSGLEQRQAMSTRTNMKLTYQVVHLLSDRVAVEALALVQVRSKLAVPMWCEESVTAGSIVADRVSISRVQSNDFFAPGQWVYIKSGLGADFRMIEDFGATDQELALVPLMGGLSHPGGSRIIPAPFAVRDGSVMFDEAPGTVVEKLVFILL